MKRKIKIIGIVFKTALVIVCVLAVLLITANTNQLFAQSNPRGKLILTVKEGAHWQHSFRIFGIIKVTNSPQMAFWLEDSSGNYQTTIYVTHRTATQDWRSSPGEKKEDIRRPSALPIWLHQHQQEGSMAEATCAGCHDLHKAKDKNIAENSPINAITGATPKTGFTREWTIPSEIKPGKYVIKAEINHSKDFNAVYKEDAAETDPNYSGGKMGSGQPSVLWQGEVTIGGQATSVHLKKVGHGQSAGKDGKMNSDLSTLDTALDILEAIQVKYLPAQK